MIRLVLYYIILGIILFLFAVDVFPNISIHNQVPDVILIFVVFIAEKKGVMKGQITGFLMGFFLDLFSGKLMGINAATKLTMGALIGTLQNQFMVADLKIQITIIAVASILNTFVNFLFLKIFAVASFWSYIQMHYIGILYTILISPLVLILLEFFDKKIVERL